jgi:hypothetical protein
MNYIFLPRLKSFLKILVAWLSGNGPKLVNELDDEELSRILTDHFRTLFPEIGNKIESPTKIIR